jgi:hypothetical protein
MNVQNAAQEIETFCQKIDAQGNTMPVEILGAALATYIHVKCGERGICQAEFLAHVTTLVQQLNECKISVRH